MQASVRPKRQTRRPRALFAAAALVGGFLVAGCGGGSGSPTVAAAPGATTPGSTAVTGGGAAGSDPSTPAALETDALAYSKCMRANGVPDFPDPNPGGGFLFQRGSGIDPSSPAFMAAQAKCKKLLPGGGPPAPARRRTRPHRRWRRWSRSHDACAGRASTTSRTLGPRSRLTWPASG